MGICLSRSLLLQSIAQTRPGNVRTGENNLSAFLSQEGLELGSAHRAYVISALKRMGRRRIWKHGGKAALIIDGTSYAKGRSRGKKRPMPGKGKVRLHNLPTQETILVPGYQEIWVCLLLADQTVLPLTRRIGSENGPDCASMNLAELAEIRRAADIVREIFKLEVILVAEADADPMAGEIQARTAVGRVGTTGVGRHGVQGRRELQRVVPDVDRAG